MGKILDKVINEMRDYSEMGMPTGETGMGMGDVPPVGMRKSHGDMGDKIKKAYRMNDILRHRGRAEEEEVSKYDNYDNEDTTNVEELKTFFKENPFPSDEEVMSFAEEHGMDMEEMRQAVYELIHDLLGGDESDDYDDYDDYESDDYDDYESDDYDDYESDDEISFNVSSDTGESPAKNENPRYRSEEREMMMRRRKLRRRW